MASPYDAIADWYDQALRRGSLIHDYVLPHIFDLAGPLAGREVCDLACGQGIVARSLAGRGATVTGIDLSAPLLAIARREERAVPLGIHYQQADAQTLPETPDATFDGVVCVMALMDMPDLTAVARTIQRVLRPQGWFVFAITHPCFETPASWWASDEDGVPYRAVRGYFQEGFWRSDNREGVRGKVGAYHRTLSAYVNAMSEAGLCLERAVEPRATDQLAERMPAYATTPAVLVARWRRA
jgi:ubiquinone/menaquinone biosynthesis C-methylase UbiE